MKIVKMASNFVLMSMVFISTSNAQGALDFADPCIKAEGRFQTTAQSLRGNAEALISKWDNLQEPPPELKSFYVDAIKEAAYKSWIDNDQNKSLIKIIISAKPEFDSKRYFYDEVYSKLLNNQQENELVNTLFISDYAVNIRPRFLKEKDELEKKIAEQKGELDSSCKKDVFNQVFRATIGNAMLMLSQNFEAAKAEKGEIAKAVRAISGISITDISKHGILGGENSELRKVAEGIAGGENSEVRKALREFDKTFNPTNWKIEPPKLEIPKLPNLPVPKPPKINWPKW